MCTDVMHHPQDNVFIIRGTLICSSAAGLFQKQTHSGESWMVNCTECAKWQHVRSKRALVDCCWFVEIIDDDGTRWCPLTDGGSVLDESERTSVIDFVLSAIEFLHPRLVLHQVSLFLTTASLWSPAKYQFFTRYKIIFLT